ncbi:MAG TPA: DMT family transporter [Sphingobium sp.]|nr:DMT family transporter [Sphingobium sp.]
MSSSTGLGAREPKGNLPALAFPALVTANVLLAAGPWFVRVADTGPIATGFWRMALALPVLLLLAAREMPRIKAPSRAVLAMIVIGGVFFATDVASWHLGILRTKLANATLFGNCSSLILPLAGIVLTRIWPTRLQWLALGLALVGALILMGGSYELSDSNLVGDLLCLVAGFLYVGYLLAVQSARRSLPSWSVLALSTLVSAPFLLFYASLAGERLIPGDWTTVAMLAFTSQILGQGLMVYAIVHFSPLIVGLALLIQPAVAALIGWVAFGETLSPLDLVGAAIIAAALVVIRLPARNAAPQPAADRLER